MKKKIAVGLALALALVMVASLGGCRFHKSHHMSHERMMTLVTREVDNRLDKIDATEQQKNAVFEAMDAIHAEFEARRAGHMADHAFLIEQIENDTPDTEAIYALVDTRIEEFKGLAHDIIDTAVELHRQFTPEQRGKLARMAKDHLSREK